MPLHETSLTVRFHEVDSFNVVWHGHYIAYCEAGRLDLAGRFGLSPEDLRSLGLFAPVVDMKCRIRASARYGDVITVKTGVVPTDRAMLVFTYRLLRQSDGALLAEAETSHVLLRLDGTMLYSVPDELSDHLAAMMDSLDGA